MPGDRTEQATPHRREKARKEGDILHSRELSAAAGTLAGVLCLGLLGTESLRRGDPSSPRFSIGRPGRWETGDLTDRPESAAAGFACEPRSGCHRRWRRLPRLRWSCGILQTGGLQITREPSGFASGSNQSASNIEEPVFASRRVAAGQVADPGGDSGGLCGAAHRARALDSAVFDWRDSRCSVRMSTGCCCGGVAAVWLGARRLPGRMAKPRIAPEDEPRGDEARSSRRPRAVRRSAAAFAACSARCAGAR